MKYIIDDARLKSVFANLMSEWSELEKNERSYDFWNQDKGRYADIDVDNFYMNVDEDWEDDQWILQYQKTPGDVGEGYELPILRYGEWWFRNLIAMFGKNLFEELLGDWFQTTYKLPINSVTTEQD